MDKRKQRTRQYLRDALLELVLEKGYDALTVQEITDRARMGRATFYLHYKDKEELLLTTLKETVAELTVRIRQMFSPEQLFNGSTPPSVIAFRHAAENKNLYRVMLNSQITGSVLSELRNLIAADVQSQLRLLAPDAALPVPAAMIGQHIAGSMLAIVSWWLETDAPYTPDEMAQMMNKLTAQPMLWLTLHDKMMKTMP
ncbi:MAG: TetR/AcrR family transcriptional regulator [Anaerolineae bacterium]